MKLVIKATGEEVQIGQQVTTFRGDLVQVTGWKKPHKPSSEGKIYVADVALEQPSPSDIREYYPGVVGAMWVEREDRPS